MIEPRRYRLEVCFRSVPVRAGESPRERGAAILAAARAICAISVGRVNAGSAVNLAGIEGTGGERAAIALDVLSMSPERGEELVGEIVDVLHEAANAPECACDLQVRIDERPAGAELAAQPLLDALA